MAAKKLTIRDQDVENLIRDIRGKKVILDIDLAALYGVETRVLNQAVKRNANRFPEGFMFRLSRQEIARISQSVTSLSGLRFSKQVHAFTEHGALQAANVLRSPRAVQMSVFVIRAFVKMRETLLGTRELAKKLSALEKQLTGRLDRHEVVIVHVLQELMLILNPPSPPPLPPQPKIGFHPQDRQ